MKTICQSCGANIDEAIRQYFWDRLPRADFDFDCPECNVTQEVEVIPVPTFKLFLKQRPKKPAPDAGDSAASSELVQASALSTSQTLSSPQRR